jgi:hypothetical protein
MSFYMATTQIAPEKTAMETSSLLSKFGANQVLTSYEDGETVGLSFCIQKNGARIPFKLPIKWQPVMIAMQNDRSTPRHLCNKDQAIRTAWRLVFRWVQAQLALVEAGAVELEEVFLPYAETRNGMTVYEIYSESKFKQLAAPS